MGSLLMFGGLMVAHALCDYPLQGDFLARAKNRHAPIPDVPWWQAMFAHCLIHAGAVAFLTGYWWLGVAEFVVHFVTDDLKCRGKINFNQDQAIHWVAKALWVLAMIVFRTYRP